MWKTILLTLFLGTTLENVVLAETCKSTLGDSITCNYGCCGSIDFPTCCPYTISTTILIVVIVVPSVLGSAIIIAVILCCMKNYCCYKQHVVQPIFINGMTTGSRQGPMFQSGLQMHTYRNFMLPFDTEEPSIPGKLPLPESPPPPFEEATSQPL